MERRLWLRDLPGAARLALALAVLVLLGGLAASMSHLVHHHENRDEEPGVSLTDLTGAYHGVSTTAPLVQALERGHPEGLADEDRELLLGWLRSDRISEGYDDLDLGDSAPAEILDRACLDCHARQAEEGGGIGREVPLEYWDDVEALSVSRRLEPTPTAILAASTHTHALTLGALTIVVGALLLATRWPAALKNLLCLGAAAGLAVDLACWWIARDAASAVLGIVVGGALYAVATALSLLFVLADLALPPRRA